MRCLTQQDEAVRQRQAFASELHHGVGIRRMTNAPNTHERRPTIRSRCTCRAHLRPRHAAEASTPGRGRCAVKMTGQKFLSPVQAFLGLNYDCSEMSVLHGMPRMASATAASSRGCKRARCGNAASGCTRGWTWLRTCGSTLSPPVTACARAWSPSSSAKLGGPEVTEDNQEAISLRRFWQESVEMWSDAVADEQPA